MLFKIFINGDNKKKKMATGPYTTGQKVKDVVTGKAAVDGAKTIKNGIVKAAKGIYNGTIGNALKVDDRHNEIIGNPKKKKGTMPTSDGYMMMK